MCCMGSRPGYQQGKAKNLQDFSEINQDTSYQSSSIETETVPHSPRSTSTKLGEKLYGAACWNEQENTHEPGDYFGCPHRQSCTLEPPPMFSRY